MTPIAPREPKSNLLMPYIGLTSLYVSTLYLTDARLMTMARILSWQSLFVHLARCPERLFRKRMRTQTDPRVILEL